MSSQRVYVFASDEIGWPVVRRTIERLPDRFEVEMTTGSYAALGPLTRWCPDVILTGRWVEDESVIPFLRLVRSRLPEASFIIIADDYALHELHEFAEIGGLSYLLWKDLRGPNLRAILNAAIRSQTLIVSRDVAAAYVASHSIQTANIHGLLLSDRERAVIDGLGQGLTQKEVAAQLHVSHRTVESDIARLKTQLDASSAFALGLAIARFVDE